MGKIKYCGECENFAYEDTDGYGFCLKTNEECKNKLSCQRYLIYARGGWDYCYVMRGCIDFQLLMQVTK